MHPPDERSATTNDHQDRVGPEPDPNRRYTRHDMPFNQDDLRNRGSSNSLTPCEASELLVHPVPGDVDLVKMLVTKIPDIVETFFER